jgi:hypothetical protein
VSQRVESLTHHQFCGHCGQPTDQGEHVACAEKLRMEPPRFCVHCRRRMVVQVTPTTWTARCAEHGEIRSP